MIPNNGCAPLALALALGFAVLGCGPQQAVQPGAAEVIQGVPQAVPPPVAVSRAGLGKLPGKWLRPDGGYVLEIKAVAAAGQLDAAYFNPNPIKVAAARATQEGGVVKVFVELRDEGYPGCTYTLTYDAPADQLSGVYYQAAQQQRYDIVFVRMP
ncbi:MAG: hypothetical protein NTV49_02385 [Kiritimatiellaeota bacterium]|nr:hypothetical protein [Kiritimatiellota bacterium]